MIFNSVYYENNRHLFKNCEPGQVEFFDPQKEFGLTTPDPPFLFKPGLKLTGKHGKLTPAKEGDPIAWTINSLGFRGSEVKKHRTCDTIRIVCLGASTTQGVNGDEQTYPAFLQKELSGLFTKVKFEVINAGFAGQNSRHLLMILKQRVLPLKPDVVLYYELGNSINEFELFTIENKGTSDSWWQILLKKLKMPLSDKRYALKDRNAAAPSIDLYMKSVRQIVQETKKAGAIALLASPVNGYHKGLWTEINVPSQYYWQYERWYPIKPEDIDYWYRVIGENYRMIAREAQIPFIDVAPTFPKDSKYFAAYGKLADPAHLSPEGDKLLARFIATFMADEIIPDLVKKREKSCK